MSDTDDVTILAELHYEDPEAALEWLTNAFGFKTRMIVSDADSSLIFAETGWGDHTVGIVPEQGESNRSPQTVGGINTQVVRFRSANDIELHCARARDAGARIVQEPKQFFFGDRTYVAADLEGHLWTFAERVPGAGGPPPEGVTVRFPSREADEK